MRRVIMHHPRSFHNVWTGIAMLAVAIVMPVSATAQVSYQYSGNPFNLFSCGGGSLCQAPGPNANTSYSASDFVTATLTVTASLPPSMTLLDATTLPGFQL